MVIYPSIFALSTLFAYFYSVSGSRHWGAIFRLLSFSLLFFPAAIRYQVGVDYSTYNSIFIYISNGTPVAIEPGFWVFNYLFAKIGGTYQLLLATISFLTISLLFVSFPKRYYHHCVAIFCLVFYAWTYTTLRQMLVCAFAYYCYTNFFLKQKYIKTYVFVALSSLFHFSGLLYVPVFIALRYFAINRLVGLYLFFFALLLIPLGQLVIDALFDAFIEHSRYGIYFSMDTPSARAAETNSGLGRVLRFLIYFLFFIPVVRFKNKKLASHGMSFLLIVIIFDILAQHMGIFARISRGYLFAYFIMIIAVAGGVSKYRVVMLSCLYAGLALLFLGGMLNGVNLPYRTIFG